MPRISDIRTRLISLIKDQPTLTRQEMADTLEVTYPAVQQQLYKLQKEGLVQNGFLVSPEWGKEYRKFWIFIETHYTGKKTSKGIDYQEQLCKAIRDKLRGKEYARILSLEGTEILIGADWDIVLTLLARDLDSVATFVTHHLRAEPYISRTRTAWSVRPPQSQPQPQSRGKAASAESDGFATV